MNKAEEYLSQSKYAEHRNVTKGYIGRKDANDCNNDQQLYECETWCFFVYGIFVHIYT